MALVRFSLNYPIAPRFICALTFALLFIPRILIADTPPSPSGLGSSPTSGNGLFPESNPATAEKSSKNTEKEKKTSPKGSSEAAHGIQLETGDEEERYKKAKGQADYVKKGWDNYAEVLEGKKTSDWSIEKAEILEQRVFEKTGVTLDWSGLKGTEGALKLSGAQARFVGDLNWFQTYFQSYLADLNASQ